MEQGIKRHEWFRRMKLDAQIATWEANEYNQRAPMSRQRTRKALAEVAVIHPDVVDRYPDRKSRRLAARQSATRQWNRQSMSEVA